MFDELCKIIRENDYPVFNLCLYEDGEFKEEKFKISNPVNNTYSVSKSFTATAAGILIDRKMLSEEDSVWDIFHAEYPDECSDTFKKVKIKHILSQTTGIERGFLDIDSDDTSLYGTEDYMHIIFKNPIVHEPGTVFTYSDSNFYLISRIVAKVSGCELCTFLQKELFGPLNFTSHAWARCPLGYSMGGTGLFLSARDMAKFGVLYLNGGIYGGKRILSEEWVKKATHTKFILPNGQGYCYGFWTSPGDEENSFRASGLYGQVIDISVNEKRVLARASYDSKYEIPDIIALAKKAENQN